ncbi:MAG TPA: PGPGW domain-containing protein [Woeseiaceae bacterium]|nr:PGPGW domain-containing protein [Woeseiaceae bacterium]
MIKGIANGTYKAARRVVVAIVGMTVLLLGVVMLVTPGPGLIVIPLGLAILSIEFAWARYWLRRVRETISSKTAHNQAENAERHRGRVESQDTDQHR